MHPSFKVESYETFYGYRILHSLHNRLGIHGLLSGPGKQATSSPS